MKLQLSNKSKYQSISVIDAHTEGEPLRIITSGYPKLEGNTILQKRQFVENKYDYLRQILMYEPRGHQDMYGALLTEATTEDGDFGILFMHNEGYSTMCGHAIIATLTVLHECGRLNVIDGETRVVNIDSPAGRIIAYAKLLDGKFNASFDCVPSFVEMTGQQVSLPGIGNVVFDIAFGGAYYAYVDADAISLDCSASNKNQLIELGSAIKRAVMEKLSITHPEQDGLSFLYGTIFTSKHVTHSGSHSRHVCIFADGELDRSPTGTGVSARAALLKHNGEFKQNESLIIESIISSTMSVSVTKELDYFGKRAVIPRVSGRAFITGESEFLIDASDPFRQGFLVR